MKRFKNIVINENCCLIVIIFILLLTNYNSLCCRDTLTFHSNEVVVRSIEIYHGNKTILKKDIEQLGITELSELLKLQTGVNLLDYGGPAALKTFSIRGTNSKQNIVSINGMKINSSQNGTIDINTLPLSFFDEIGIIKNTSQIYSANFGGQLNLTSSNNKEKAYTLNLNYGSFNTIELQSSINEIILDLPMKFSINWKNSDGDFKYIKKDYGKEIELNRQNDFLKNINLSYSSEYTYGKSNYYLLTIYRDTERGIPGAVIQGKNENSKANLNESELFLLFTDRINISDTNSLHFNLLAHSTNTLYKDSDAVYLDLVNRQTNFKSLNLQFNSDYQRIMNNSSLSTLLELEHNQLEGQLIKSINGQLVKRDNLALSLNYFKELVGEFKAPLSINNSIRYEIVSDFKPQWSGIIGFDYIFDHENNGVIGLNISKNYRLPNFNEIYYFNYGNTNLKPEEAISYNLSLAYNILDNMVFNSSVYLINIDNQIISIPTNIITWSAQNLAKVQTKGIEVGLKYKIDKELILNCDYSYNLSLDNDKSSLSYEKQIVYLPKNKINLTCLYLNNFVNISATYTYTGIRYFGFDNGVDEILNSYNILNLGIFKNLNFEKMKLNLRFDVYNSLNTNYSILPNYPLPLVNYKLSLGINFK